MFLYSKRKPRPKRLSFAGIKKEDILCGNCIIVRDEISKVIPYANPLRNYEYLITNYIDPIELENRRELLLKKEYTKKIGEEDYQEYLKIKDSRPIPKRRIMKKNNNLN